MRLTRFSVPLLQKSIVLSVISACFMTNALAAQQTQADSTPRVWLLNFKKGDVRLHRSKTILTGKSSDGKTEMNLVLMPTEKIEIKDVNTKGDATIVDTPIALEVTQNGKTQKVEGASFSATTMTISKMGLLLKEEGDTDIGSNSLIAVQSLLSNMPVPLSPVKPGESWKTELENRLIPGKKVVMITTFLGTETVYGIDTVKTKFTLSMPTVPNASDPQTIRAEGIRSIDIQTGQLVKSDLKIQNVEYATPKGVVRGSVEVSNYLLVPGINDTDTSDASPKK